MHKKLAADLSSLAHEILQMKDKNDVKALKKKAHQIYEKLSVLDYVEEYINTTPQATETKESLLEKIERAEEQVVEQVKEEIEVIKYNLEDEYTEAVEEVEEEKHVEEEVEEIINEVVKEVKQEVEKEVEEISEGLFGESTISEGKSNSLEDELKDTVALDVVANLFENAPKRSLNDRLQGDIQIGLNDRIAFVKNLFDGSQEDFNRVVSQLNSFKTENEAKKFINKIVKPDYNWVEKEEFEERFMLLVERKFG